MEENFIVSPLLGEMPISLEMDVDIIRGRCFSIENFRSRELETDSNNVGSLDVLSSCGYYTREVESAAKILRIAELDLACSSEKLVNLDVLVLHVAARENDFQAFALEDELSEVSAEKALVFDLVSAYLDSGVRELDKALEFDLLSGFLESEVRELDSFLSTLQTDMISFREIMPSFVQLGEVFKEMEENLQDCEECLKQSFEHISEIKVQSGNFQGILLSTAGDRRWKDGKQVASFDNRHLVNLNTSIEMLTAEQQRHILRMLEKSLASELELDKKLTESRETEELNRRLRHEVNCMMAESEVTFRRMIEAEYTAEVLMGISKELLRRVQSVEFNLNASVQREGELRSKLQNSESTIKDMADLIETLKSKASKAETKGVEEKRIIRSKYNSNLRVDKFSKR